MPCRAIALPSGSRACQDVYCKACFRLAPPQVFFAPAWGETHVVLGAVMGMPYRQLQYTREQGVERQRRLEMR